MYLRGFHHRIGFFFFISSHLQLHIHLNFPFLSLFYFLFFYDHFFWGLEGTWRPASSFLDAPVTCLAAVVGIAIGDVKHETAPTEGTDPEWTEANIFNLTRVLCFWDETTGKLVSSPPLLREASFL